ncbi:MAG: hypothetical protein Q9160_007294 [Pyrenula sp. 1 TL-2023]
MALQLSRVLYTIYFILFATLKISYLSVRYLTPSSRPCRTWSYQLALNNELVKLFFKYWSVTKAPQPRIKSDEQKDLFTSLNPAPPSLYCGPLADTSIQPRPVNGIWHPRRPSLTDFSNSPQDFIILHFHGGAYVLLSPQDSNVSEGLDALASSLPVSALFAPEFRLASRPNCPFPAQLQDAVSAFAYLLNDLSIPASRIVLSGDSAGGNIVVSLLRYLHEYAVLPLPAAALLHSPWLNLSVAGCTVENNPNERTDFLSTAYIEWGARSFTPKGMDREDQWISPFFHPFRCKVPIWVQDGTAEVLHSDIVEWIEKMRRLGTKVEYYGAEHMVHNLLIVVKFMGVSEQRAKALAAAKDFLGNLG